MNIYIDHEYLYSAFHNIDCIKAASQYQSIKKTKQKKNTHIITMFVS